MAYWAFQKELVSLGSAERISVEDALEALLQAQKVPSLGRIGVGFFFFGVLGTPNGELLIS